LFIFTAVSPCFVVKNPFFAQIPLKGGIKNILNRPCREREGRNAF
jgi:hypothetical protein